MEIINWILWSLGICVVIVALFFGVSWFIFWFTEILTDAKNGRDSLDAVNRAKECHRWLSGFEDLDLIWDYIFRKGGYLTIDGVRTAYAKSRGMTVYGEPTDASPETDTRQGEGERRNNG